MGKGEPLQVQLPALHSINPDSGELFSVFSGRLLFPLFILQDDL